MNFRMGKACEQWKHFLAIFFLYILVTLWLVGDFKTLIRTCICDWFLNFLEAHELRCALKIHFQAYFHVFTDMIVLHFSLALVNFTTYHVLRLVCNNGCDLVLHPLIQCLVTGGTNDTVSEAENEVIVKERCSVSCSTLPNTDKIVALSQTLIKIYRIDKN